MESGNYYSQVIKSKQYDPLSPDEEKRLAEKIRTNDHQRESRNRLVCGCLRFAVLVASKYQGAGLSMEDLVQEANRGLIEAAGRFDGSKNFKFVSYAVWWIRRYILFALNDYGRIVRVPMHAGQLTVEVRRTIEDLQQWYQREPTDEEIANELKIDDKLIRLLDNTNHNVSLNTPHGDDNGELIDILTYKEDEKNIDDDAVNSLLDSLIDEREKKYIRQYYMSGYSVDLQTIADRDNLSRERVRQIIDKGIKRLRKRVKKTEVYV